MVKTIRNRFVTPDEPETPAVPTVAPPTSSAPPTREVDVDAIADSILSQTEEPVTDGYQKFIDEAASYQESQRDKMLRFATRDLSARQGHFFGSPYMRAASMRVGATGGSLLARITGHEDAANRVQRLGAAYAEAHRQQVEGQTFPGVDAIAKSMLDVGSEMTVQAPFIGLAATTGGLAGLGTPAVITTQAVTTADQAYTQALDSGKGERAAAQHAIGMGVIEGGVTGIMSAVGLGGTERLFGAASKPMQAGVRAAMRSFSIGSMSELTEEYIVYAGQAILSWLDGVDPDALTWDRTKQAVKDINRMTIATHGAYSAPGMMASRSRAADPDAGHNPRVEALRDRILRVAEDVSMRDRGVSRGEWSDMGFSRMTGETEVERTTLVQDMAEQIQAMVREASLQEDPQATADETQARVEAEQAPQPETQQETPTEPEQAVSPEPAPVKGEQQAPEPTEQGVEGDVTSTANVVTQRLREGYSLPGLEAEPAESQVQWAAEAQDRIAVDNMWVESTINDVLANKRAPTPIENAGIAIHMQELKQGIDQRVKLINDVEAPDDGKATAQTEAELLIGRLDQAISAAEIGGTAAGRQLAARKLTVNENYDVGTLLAREQIVRKRPLTKDEISEVTQLAKEIETLQAELATERAKSQERSDTEGLDGVIAQAKRRRGPSKRKRASQSRRKAAGEQFKAALNNLESFKPSVADFLKGETGAVNIPVELLQAGVEYVKAAVADGYVTFSEFWADSHTEVGDFSNSKEVFRQAWERVRESGGVEQTSIKPDQHKEIANYASKMIDAVVRSGETNREAVIREVHDELLRVVPGIDHRSALDAMTRQGKYRTQPKAKTETQQSIAELKKQLKLVQKLRTLTEGKVPEVREGKPAEQSSEVEALKRQIKEAEDRSPAIKEAREKAREETYTKSLENRLAEYQRMLKEGDTGVKERGSTPKSRKINDLQYEIEIAKGKVKVRREKARIDAMNAYEKTWHRLKKVLHTQRTVMLSMDLPLLRQGAFYAYSHPVKAARDTWRSFQAWKSERGYHDAMQSIKEDPYHKTFQEMGIDFTEMDGDFTKAEEDYAGGYLKNLTEVAGVKYIAEPIQASARGHGALMNLIRAGHARIAIDAFGGPDGMTDSQKKVLGRLVNVTSGRGDLGSLEKHAEAAALVFLAPRYVVSRFQQGIALPVEAALGARGHDAKTRTFYLQEYTRAITGFLVFGAMIQAALNFMSPEEERELPEHDPRSTGFLKPRIGNTMLDLSGGVSQTSVLLRRIQSGEYKNRKGEIKPLRGPGVKYGDYEMEDVLDRFARYKFAPWLSFTYDMATQKTGGGFEDATAANLAKNYLVPIPVVDVFKSTEDVGFARGVVVNAIMEAGGGMQTYDEKAKQKGVVPNPFATDGKE